MRVKTYRGTENKAVMDRIKAELGPDAVILGVRNYKEDGVNCCEIMAALEDAAETRTAKSVRSSAAKPGDGPASMQPFDPTCMAGWGQWQSEWLQIKDHLTALMKPQLNYGALTPFQRQALEFLEREGVDAAVILDVFRALKDNPKVSILAPLERIVSAEPWCDHRWPQKFHAVAGPHGVGKTSALVRMALALKQEAQDCRICVVNADQHRLGSRLALKQYAELTGFSYIEVADATEFASLVASSREYDKVLVDLPGLDKGMTLERLMDKLGLDAAEDLRVHLVLSPFYAPTQLRAFERQYYAPQAASLIWTKLDEASGFGAMVNTAATTGLPVSALSYGAAMSETLSPAKQTALWRLVFKHRLPNEQ
jgi:flagellar biosynthesis protein FlhF